MAAGRTVLAASTASFDCSAFVLHFRAFSFQAWRQTPSLIPSQVCHYCPAGGGGSLE